MTVDKPSNELEEVDAETDRVAGLIIEGAFRAHRALGPGLLESAYETCLVHEAAKLGLSIARQSPVPIFYNGIRLEAGFRLDLLVENRVILEIKSVEALLPIHEAQLMTYLRLTDKRLGLLINFNSRLLKWGIKRIVLTPKDRPK